MTGAVIIREGEIRQTDPGESIAAIDDCYSSATRVFLRFLEDTGRRLDAEGIRAFSAYLREEHGGARLQARTVNFYLAAVKARVRYLLAHSQVDDETRAKVELTLAELRLERVANSGVDAERCLSYQEIGRLAEFASARNPRVALIVEFLAVTGCRISETLSALNADVRAAGQAQYRVLVHGKGGKDRKVFIPADLYSRIRLAFPGRKYLFAHGGERTYSREYVSMAIGRYARKALGRSFSAHGLRHSFATAMLKANPGDLVAISRYLGHAQVSTTENIYLHGSYTGADIAATAPRIPLATAG